MLVQREEADAGGDLGADARQSAQRLARLCDQGGWQQGALTSRLAGFGWLRHVGAGGGPGGQEAGRGAAAWQPLPHVRVLTVVWHAAQALQPRGATLGLGQQLRHGAGDKLGAGGSSEGGGGGLRAGLAYSAGETLPAARQQALWAGTPPSAAACTPCHRAQMPPGPPHR